MDIKKEIIDKYKFLRKYKKLGKRGIMRFQGVTKARFLQSKVLEMDQMMDRASDDIDIAIDKYSQHVDIELTDAQKNVNEIMMIFSLVAIAVIPPQVIGGIMGMNVQVPGQNIESLWPFWFIISLMVGLSILVVIIFMYMMR